MFVPTAAAQVRSHRICPISGGEGGRDKVVSKAQAQRENVSDLAQLGLTVLDAYKLQGLAHRLHRLNEAECNYGLSNRQERRRERLWAEVELMARSYGLYVYHQDDPRGWPIVIDSQPIQDNSIFGKTTVCPY